MPGKLHMHKVTLSERKREKKRTEDGMRRAVPKEAIKHAFDSYYRDQVRALYKRVINS
ncbi:MAG: hypothetical protein PHH49_00415 [Candidatus Omnitrophica bacterium]|nr:hypothetical protein [Candidatus Omnitrophota bacterium]MDD5487416.1 hypothetical protein [Candidatus Omnitrophota bacterium]